MITTEIKNKAIALYSSGTCVADISDELNLPQALVQEWVISIDSSTNLRFQSQGVALEKLKQMGKTIPVELMQNKLEEAAYNIATELSRSSSDLESARILELNAKTIAILYNSIVNKGINAITNNNTLIDNSESKFSKFLKD
jgi:transposase-like protein